MMRELKEGDIVVSPNKNKLGTLDKQVKGTIWLLSGSDSFVVDSSGYIHQVKTHELYKAQD